MRNTWKLLVAAAVLFAGAFVLFNSGAAGTEALWNLSREGAWLLPLVAVAALLDSVNPCAFGILLLTIAFLFSIGTMRAGILKIGAAYILGIFAVYLLIGLGILQALHLFNTPHFMAKVGAGLLIALGSINVLGAIFPSFPIRFHIPKAAHDKMAHLMEKASMPTAFLLGALVGLCEFPCTGGPYLMVLGLLHDTASYLTGVAYLLLYNLIFIAPLAIVLALASEKTLIEKVRQWKSAENTTMKIWAGVGMILLGVIIYLL
ncbi:MAG: hypothetical protein UY63_C0003G0004 [Parcubacteria group bacterium GW2011_GWA2_51_10]|nr:MAG: hypothetical protein UY63_C0003G0004 [Parcubacteria group bacterium GW2011_GWA2_51_10]